MKLWRRECRHSYRHRRTVGLEWFEGMTVPPSPQPVGFFGGPGPPSGPSPWSNGRETIECGKCGHRWTVVARIVG